MIIRMQALSSELRKATHWSLLARLGRFRTLLRDAALQPWPAGGAVARERERLDLDLNCPPLEACGNFEATDFDVRSLECPLDPSTPH